MSPTSKKARGAAAKKPAAKKPATKKPATKKPAAKKPAAKKPAAKKPAAKKPAAKKTATKKPATKKTATKKPAGQKAVQKKAVTAPSKKSPSATKKAAKKATPERSRTTPPAPRKARGRGTKKAEREARRVAALPVALHPRFGRKFECFGCGAKFYDMGKEDPVCPKCGVDQRDRPSERLTSPSPIKPPRKSAARPMAPLLDDDDDVPVSTREDIATIESKTRSGEGFFDDAVENVAEETDDSD